MPRSLFTTTMIVLAAAGMLAIGWPTAAEADFCSNTVRSKNSNTPVTVTFVNKSGEYRGVMWADFKGKLVPYAKI